MELPKKWRKGIQILLVIAASSLILGTTACEKSLLTMNNTDEKTSSRQSTSAENQKKQASSLLAAISGSEAPDVESSDGEVTGTLEPTKKPSLRSLYQKEKSGTIVDLSGRSKKEVKKLFYAQKIPKDIFQYMKGRSYHAGCPVKRSQLRHVRVLYMGFDKKPHIGELIVNKSIANDIVSIFYKLYQKKYQIEKMELIDAYDGDDDESMADNNTSCFNYRPVKGTTHLSRHSYGLAIDINPRYNPYIHTLNGKTVCEPSNGAGYVDRTKTFPHKIDLKDLCYQLFVARGYTWGGNWRTVKDYQHFQK